MVPGARAHSVDELSAELGPRDDPETIVEGVKRAICASLGAVVTVSCAAAANSFLAKTAAEATKPDAAVVWRDRDIREVYEALELADLPGLGPATNTRLRARDIDSVTALYHLGRPGAERAWGSVVGAYVHSALHGHDEWPAPRPRQRLSHGRELEPALRTWERARPLVRFVASCVMHRCRLEGVAPRRLALEILTGDLEGLTAAAPVAPTNDERRALRAVSALWDGLAGTTADGPRRFAVTALDLVRWPSPQPGLFDASPADVQALLDTVHARSGARALTLGESADRTGRYTGVKISFEHIPSLDEFAWLGIEVPPVGAAGATCMPRASAPRRVGRCPAARTAPSGAHPALRPRP